MHGLNHRRIILTRLRPAGPSDRGAVATIVTILLAFGVLLGMAALVIDVGRLYSEREELQSGADAAVIAIAKACAESPADCGGIDPWAVGEQYADDNAKDGASDAAVICVGNPPDGGLGGLPSCDDSSVPAPATNLTACIGDPPEDAPYVEVRTRTEMEDGSTLLPPTLAQTILGNEGFEGTTVGACARAGYGPPETAKGIAMTISICEWNASTSEGTAFADPPPYPPNPDQAFEKVAYLHTDSKAGTCGAGPSGADAPGGFGWLDDPDATCSATVSADGTADSDTGVNVSGPCQQILKDARNNQTVLFVPIYDQVTEQGTNTTYHIVGMAAFVVTGYNLPSLNAPSWLTGTKYCKGNDFCVYGFFTKALVPAAGTIGGPDLGASIVTLIG